jgi:glycerol-3-phosphate dehydrogenase
MPDTVAGHCYTCGADRQILVTVPWQDDQCAACGSTDVEITEPA